MLILTIKLGLNSGAGQVEAQFAQLSKPCLKVKMERHRDMLAFDSFSINNYGNKINTSHRVL